MLRTCTTVMSCDRYIGPRPESALAKAGSLLAATGFRLSPDKIRMIFQVNKLRATVERAIAHLKSWRILHTDYRRPLRTYITSYRAAVGLYFFKLNFG